MIIYPNLILSFLAAFAALQTCGALCSTATIDVEGVVIGDASETAILKFICSHAEPFAIRNKFPKVAEIPFNSNNKYHVSSFSYNTNNNSLLYIYKHRAFLTLAIFSRLSDILGIDEIERLEPR